MQNNQSPFHNLMLLFKDQPEVLQLLDPLMLDATQAEGELARELLRKEGIFETLVNLYVTGKSRVGKSALGNNLFGGNILPSSGHVDCTDALYVASIGPSMRYMDLPGAGTGEAYEGINRDVLLMEGRDLPGKFRIVKKTGAGDEQENVTRQEWAVNQKTFQPHVCIYMAAPHIGLFRNDLIYLEDLLRTFKKRFDGKDRMIFAINLHTRNGQPSYAEHDLADVEEDIHSLFEKIFPGTAPVILRINALNSNGLHELAQAICDKLELSQVQNLYKQFLPGLREKAGRMKEQRFLKLLCYLAARLSTRKADSAMLDRNLLYEAYLSIYIYGMLVFFNEKADEHDLGPDVQNASDQAIAEKQDILIVQKPVTVKEEIKGKKITDIYEDVQQTEYFAMTTTVSVKTRRTPILDLGIRDWLRPKYVDEERTTYVPRVVTKKEYRGQKEEIVTLDVVEKIVGYEQQSVNQGYLKGGYEFITGIFSLGLGINKALRLKDPGKFQFNFTEVFNLGRDDATSVLKDRRSAIGDINNRYTTPKEAEKAILELLLGLFNTEK